MKKSIMILLVIAGIVAASFSLGEAQVFSLDSPFTPSYMEIIPDFDGLGNHVVLTFQSTDNFGSYFAVLLDSDGVPVKSSVTFGFFYLFADLQSDGSLIIYGSDTGFADDWHEIFF